MSRYFNTALRLSNALVKSYPRTILNTQTFIARHGSTIGMKHNISVGDEAELNRTFTEEEVEQFAKLSRDSNPMHLSDEFAKQGRFGKRVVHGHLTMSLVSGIIGTTLPGPGCILVAQEAEFIAPLFIGETVTCKFKITGLKKLIIYGGFSCVTPSGKEVLKGQVTLLYQPNRPSEKAKIEENSS